MATLSTNAPISVYATLVFHEVYNGKYHGTYICSSEDETLEVIRSKIFNSAGILQLGLPSKFINPNATIEATSSLSALELAEFNNEYTAESLLSVNGSIGGVIISYRD